MRRYEGLDKNIGKITFQILDIRKYAFFQRTVNECNKLPGECVNAISVTMFKNKLGNYFKGSLNP